MCSQQPEVIGPGTDHAKWQHKTEEFRSHLLHRVQCKRQRGRGALTRSGYLGVKLGGNVPGRWGQVDDYNSRAPGKDYVENVRPSSTKHAGEDDIHDVAGLLKSAIAQRIDVPRFTIRFSASLSLKASHPTSLFPEEVVTKVPGETSGRARSRASHTGGEPSSTSTGYEDDMDKSADALSTPTSRKQNPSLSNSDMDGMPDADRLTKKDDESESEVEAQAESGEEDVEEQHTPLSYQIPLDVLRSATEAPANTRTSYWSQNMYRGPEGEKIKIHYCQTLAVAEKVAEHFLQEKVVGFDIEWNPEPVARWSIQENVSLIQLACEDRIALFHIALFKGWSAKQLLPLNLKIILESPDIQKVGVHIKADFTRVRKYLGVHQRGVFELSRLHNLVETGKRNHSIVSLASQVRQHLHLPLHKGEPLVDEPGSHTDPAPEAEASGKSKRSVRHSDWSQKLTNEQIVYAADDAYAGFRLWDVLESKRKSLKPVPDLPQLCDLDPDRPRRRPRAKPKTKRAGKPNLELETVVAEAAIEVDEEPEEGLAEDAEGYATAPEELGDDAETEILGRVCSESLEPNKDDSDREYVPSSSPQSNMNTAMNAQERPRTRVGRVKLPNLDGFDPGYPVLPTVSSTEESDSTDSPTFDPLRTQKPIPKQFGSSRTTAHTLPTQNPTPERSKPNAVAPDADTPPSDDEYADPDLEEALMAIDQSGGVPAANTQRKQPTETDPSPEPPSSTLPPTTPSHSPEYTLATTWAQSHLNATIPPSSSQAPSRIRATLAHLRAYHLWHHQRLPLSAIAAQLRAPPLAQTTVATYILQAVSLEGLECGDAELRQVLEMLPKGTRGVRWRALSRRVGLGV